MLSLGTISKQLINIHVPAIITATRSGSFKLSLYLHAFWIWKWMEKFQNTFAKKTDPATQYTASHCIGTAITVLQYVLVDHIMNCLTAELNFNTATLQI